ncbi:MAG: hypothetical protein IIU91_00105, partial [Alistipes sp.]|nr:hypothetical protein [Alistipes sp.]
MVVELPTVQNFLVGKATKYVSEKLETEVSIRRIKIGVLGSLRVDGFYVEDYQQDTLLYVDKLRVYLSRIPDQDGVTLRNGVVSHGVLNIKETPEGVMNIKQVVARLSNKDRGTVWSWYRIRKPKYVPILFEASAISKGRYWKTDSKACY